MNHVLAQDSDKPAPHLPSEHRVARQAFAENHQLLHLADSTVRVHDFLRHDSARGLDVDEVGDAILHGKELVIREHLGGMHSLERFECSDGFGGLRAAAYSARTCRAQ